MISHQQKQVEVINQLAEQIKSGSIEITLVEPVSDFENDQRRCLAGIHLPSDTLKSQVEELIIEPLKKIEPGFYFYPRESLHTTIKSVRVSNYPLTFTEADIEKAKEVFQAVIPNHHKFKVYFYKLLLFPNNLALVGTTDPELDNIIFDLDRKLNEAGLPDDKKYINSRYFFSNITLARFSNPPSEEFKEKVKELSGKIMFESYTVDSVSLVIANAVFKKLKILKIIDTWFLK